MFDKRPQPRFPVRSLLLVLLVLTWALAATAQTTTPPPAPAGNVTSSSDFVTFHGFISATAFAQNQNFTFGNGQNAEFPNPPETKTDRWFLDGDVRNTRFNFGFNGPKIDDLKLGATLEADFFGGFNGTGGYSNAQPNPRLRLAYIDLVRGKTTFRMGQAFAPLFGNVPVSYSHIAFPLGYGATGFVGWRFPGVFLIQDLTPAGSATTTKFTLAVLRNTWAGPGDNVNSGSAGQAGLPQVEARFDFGSKTWSTYVVGHVDKKDLSGAGTKSANDSLTGYAAEFGAKVTSGPFMLQGNAVYGKAIGQQFGQMAQFGDIKSVGGWLQGGYNFTKRWSGYLFAGVEKANKDDVIAAKAPRKQNAMGVASLMYNNGPYGFNLEFLHDRLTSAADVKTSGDQVAASVIYKF